jgi:hypothetical protein
MLELRNVRQMLEEAEQAARTGDFLAADQLLRDIARIQSAELGPQHPELANTLNNLAIIAERRGRADEAERFYQQSAAIASATLPPDHPMVVTSRQNLEAFRMARESLKETPGMDVPDDEADLGLDVFAREDNAKGKKPAARKQAAPQSQPVAPKQPVAEKPPVAEKRAAERPAAEKPPSAKPVPKAPAQPPPAQHRKSEPRAPAAPQPPPRSQTLDDIPLSDPRFGATIPPRAASRASGSRVWIVLAVIALVTVGVVASRPSLLRDAELLLRDAATGPATPDTEAPAADAEPASPPPPPPAAPSPASAPRPSSAAPDAAAASGGAPTAPASAAGMSLAAADVCRRFSTGNWRCDPAGDSVDRGPLVLYTRVKSPRGGTVVHRWYHGDTLRRSVPLTVRGNANEGFRTYSRLTVDEPGDWRVEVETEDGALLHEQRFTVR